MKKLAIGTGGVATLALLVVAGGVLWARSAAAGRLAQTFESHSVELAVPTPLVDDELAALRAERQAELTAEDADAVADADGEGADLLTDVDLDALAQERALARGKHLVEARFACIECHGDDFSGGVMIDSGAIGTWLGPNLTTGEGSRTVDYTMADWDRIVRHGVKPDGTPAVMPSEDFANMSDQELSDIIAWIQTMPPVDNVVPAPTLGPIGTMLMATGAMPLSAEHFASATEHRLLPPKTSNTVEFGQHLAQVCTGCHRSDFTGGPMPFGPPEWPAAANLTTHGEGLEGWTEAQFVTLMTTGARPDGTAVVEPMELMTRYGQNMEPIELQALWTYIQSLPPMPTGE